MHPERGLESPHAKVLNPAAGRPQGIVGGRRKHVREFEREIDDAFLCHRQVLVGSFGG
jgi:hypothetical protein